MIDIFCPRCNTLVLDESDCKCGWNRLVATSQTQGMLAWQRTLPGMDPSGLTLAANILYVQDGERNLHAIDARIGEELWPKPPSLGTWQVNGRVAVGGGLVVVGPMDNQSLPVADKAVLAFDAASGEECWRSELGVGQISEPLIVDDKVLLATSDGYAVALALADGSVEWRVPIGGYYATAPALTRELVIFGGDKGSLTALRLASGTQVWRFTAEAFGHWLPSFRYTPTVIDDVVYATCWNRRCYALDSDSGTLRWMSDPTQKRPAMTSCLVVEDAVYFAAHDRHIYCLDTGTGAERWRHKLPKRSEVLPQYFEGTLYVAALDGQIYRLDAESGEQSAPPVAQTKGKISQSWAADDAHLYWIDSQGKLSCLVVRQPEAISDPEILFAQGEWRQAADILALQGELRQAAEIYQQNLQEPYKAAQLYERAGLPELAAQAYVTAQRWQDALNIYESRQQWDKLANVAQAMGNVLLAAQAYEKANQWRKAGHCYYKLKKWSQAAIALEKAAAAAKEQGADEKANEDWRYAAKVYQHLDQPAKAVDLLMEAGARGEAEEILRVWRAEGGWSERILNHHRRRFGALKLAKMLAEEGSYVLAAHEYARAKEHAAAARMYEQAEEYRLAAEQYKEAGDMNQAARTMELMKDWDAAAELYLQVGNLAQAAVAFVQAGDHRRAAEAYEALAQWGAAADQWLQIERWRSAALAWEQAGERLQAKEAWLQEGEKLHAARQVREEAQRLVQTDTADKAEAAKLFEQAMQLFQECGDGSSADACDRMCRFYRRQPLLHVDALKHEEFVADHWGKLAIVVQNQGWGQADNIFIAASGHFETDLSQVPQKFGLAVDHDGESVWYIQPAQAGTVPLHLNISYTDGKGKAMPSIKHTVEIQVADAGSGRITPGQIQIDIEKLINVRQATNVAGGDQVNVQRQNIAPATESPAREDAPPIPTIVCPNCGSEQPATARKCSQCKVPIIG